MKRKRGLFSGIPFKAKAALDIMGCTANHVSKTALEHNYYIKNIMAYFCNIIFAMMSLTVFMIKI